MICMFMAYKLSVVVDQIHVKQQNLKMDLSCLFVLSYFK